MGPDYVQHVASHMFHRVRAQSAQKWKVNALPSCVHRDPADTFARPECYKDSDGRYSEL
jgi:hypothetical protein